MSDSNTPTEIPQTPEQGTEDFDSPTTLTPVVLNELKDILSGPKMPESEVVELRGVFEADQEEAFMVGLERDNPQQYIAQLGAMAVVRNKAEAAKFATKAESRTYKQVADGVIARDENQNQTIAVQKRKPRIDFLDTNTRLGRFVSMVVFGEKSPKAPKLPKATNNFNPRKKFAEQELANKLAGGAISTRALQRIIDNE